MAVEEVKQDDPAKSSDGGLDVHVQKHHIILELYESGGAFRMSEGLPMIPFIGLVEILKTSLLSMQMQSMTKQALQQRANSVSVATGGAVPLPPQKLDRRR